MKVLITGVAGMIGARLADWIAEHQPQVEIVGIDDLSGGYLENINPKVQFYKQNLADDISAIFEKEKPDIVYHLAAYAAEGLSPFVRVFNYQNNLIATTRVITQCIKHGVKRLVYTSSMSVYGRGKVPFDERDQQAPIDPYGVAKFAAEMDIQIAHEQHGLEYSIIRPHNVYGAKQNIWDKYRNVLGIWMYRLMNDEPISVFGDGEQQRAFSYIDDITEPLWNAAISPKAAGQIINLGGIHECTINEAADTLIKVVGHGQKVHLESRHEVKHAWSTYQKSIDLLGFEHRTNLEQGLTKMWEWAQQQPIRHRFEWTQYELEVGVYSYWKK